jgi:UDP-galactopyranose mutase
MTKKKVIVLGAGLAGLSTAWHLQKSGINCRVFEKEDEVGGLCRSNNVDGFIFDHDGHLLHFKHNYVFNLIKDLLGKNLVEHERSAWVYSRGIYSRYPFQANLYGLPPAVRKECLLGFINATRNSKPINKINHTFLDWINHTLGDGIARHFMIPYNTKFWTLPPKKLTCEWLDDFIPVPSLSQLVEGTLDENSRQFGYNARFWYPKKGGISEVPLSFRRQLKNIYTNCPLTEINLEKKEIKINAGNKEKYDYLIYTLPLPEVEHLIKGLPKEISALSKKLRWNSIFNVNLGIDHKDTSKRHWVYFPGKETCFFRVGFPHNFSATVALPNKSSIYAEVSYSKDLPVDKNNAITRIKEDLKKVKILNQNGRICAQWINDIKYGYPIYDKNYGKARAALLSYLNQNNIIACGRYGSWRYMSMEQAILNGNEVAKSLSKNFRR